MPRPFIAKPFEIGISVRDSIAPESECTGGVDLRAIRKHRRNGPPDGRNDPGKSRVSRCIARIACYIALPLTCVRSQE